MEHGTVASYNDGCRCELCRAAIARYRREHYDSEGRNTRLKQKYRAAREAGFSPAEARRRAHWANPTA